MASTADTSAASRELSAAWAPLERLIAELEGRLRAQEQRGRELRLRLLAAGYLPTARR